ncbi:redox-regulated ATPase YchF [Peloplasma aerotolerans]|uniref:Ribosome-binding ATPase YchF n=1 Tax=Peloplasma aerotolerans TaxID=3044389 RepID=A0AAW6U2G4_9MOLU|nr:redox-regulated ATPase YchF [Mariniplasma sp. M4Ah]MDI6452072.1 redox-regulated ATPase YchF [Mariniplasma sp. M4Ah]
MLKAGIVGLPNVGKSTLFNAITKAEALAANYPFATIEPNVGIVFVQDKRLDVLAQKYKPKKVVPTAYEFIDIAGLVRGASKGEGLGNQFLSHIREVDAICQVVRCFDDENVTHVDGKVDPIRDIETIKIELNLADIESIEKRIQRLEKKVKTKSKEAIQEQELLKHIKDTLDKNESPRLLDFTEEELKIIKNFNLLTMKPMIYIANVAEEGLHEPEKNPHYQNVLSYAKQEKTEVVLISAQVEMEIASLQPEEQLTFLEAYGLEKSGLNEVIEKSYDLLGLKTYFTAGEPEVRAWTFKNGMKAPQCAGIIHSDFERGFIKAETLAYDDLIKYGTPQVAKENGRVRLEGKDYVVKDGDIMLFRFNV